MKIKTIIIILRKHGACYDCIVSQNGVTSDILNTSGFEGTNLGKIFYRALAREKYNLYKVNDYLNDT